MMIWYFMLPDIVQAGCVSYLVTSSALALLWPGLAHSQAESVQLYTLCSSLYSCTHCAAVSAGCALSVLNS